MNTGRSYVITCRLDGDDKAVSPYRFVFLFCVVSLSAEKSILLFFFSFVFFSLLSRSVLSGDYVFARSLFDEARHRERDHAF